MSGIRDAKVSIDQLVFKSLYYRYKAFVMPVSVIGICFVLFAFVVMPQIQNWLSLRDVLTVDAQNLQVLHQNIALVTSLDDAKLNDRLATATSALPAQKDFAGIITSLQNAAAIAGVDLGDYSFQLGDLSGQDQSGKASQLPLQLNVALRGNITGAQRFMSQLRQQLPLSDAIALSVNADTSITVTVIFYYAALPHISFTDTQPLPVLANGDKQLLDNLAVESNIGLVTLASPSVSQHAPTQATNSAQ